MKLREAYAMLNAMEDAASFFAKDTARLKRQIADAVRVGAINPDTELTGVSSMSAPAFDLERTTLQKISDIISGIMQTA